MLYTIGIDWATKDHVRFIRSSAVAIFIMWLKIFTFLRLFKWTNAIYRIVIEIIKDMISFLVLFFMIISAFSNSFYVLGHNDGKKEFQDESFL
jgi:hypothetical protein